MTTKNFRFKSSPFKANPVGATTATCQCGWTIPIISLFSLASRCRNPSSSSAPLNICWPVKMVGLHHGAISLLLAFSATRRHQRKIALNPVEHKAHVKKRLFVQRWHPFLSTKLSAEGRKTVEG